jgi:hypothetical protein
MANPNNELIKIAPGSEAHRAAVDTLADLDSVLDLFLSEMSESEIFNPDRTSGDYSRFFSYVDQITFITALLSKGKSEGLDVVTLAEFYKLIGLAGCGAEKAVAL